MSGDSKDPGAADRPVNPGEYTVGINFEELAKQKAKYRCPKGHTLEYGAFEQPLYFNFGTGGVPVCTECIKDFVNANLRLTRVEPEKNG